MAAQHEADVSAELPRIEVDDFTRRFTMRGSKLMWFLGAGASASAGMPTAWDLIWEFKQRLFVTQRRVSHRRVADLSNPQVRQRLQEHIDMSDRLPREGDSDEYAALFEAVFPAEEDRRTFLDGKRSGAKPSYGHVALATLMRAGHARLLWTTNFDTLIADACAEVYGATSALTSVTLDAPDVALQALNAERWPLEIKLHGDFRSRRLKNTPDELRHQDAQLRQRLVEACGRYGMVVVGYSGRDESIMTALEEAVARGNAFQGGLFWLHRQHESPLPRVAQLVERAVQTGVEAAAVGVENFDEVLRDIVRAFGDALPTDALDRLTEHRRIKSPAPRLAGSNTAWPVVRLNGLRLTKFPAQCRRIDCKIEGVKAVRDAVAAAGVDVIATRTSAGVLAFGANADVRSAFQSYGIAEFNIHVIEEKRLRRDSTERGLLRDALATALERSRGLRRLRRRTSDLFVPADPSDGTWQPLREVVGELHGVVPRWPGLTWREGVQVRLDWADDRLWLLLDPRIAFDGTTDDNKAASADFGRERMVRRYNRQANQLIDVWAALLAGDEGDFRALEVHDGIDAVFQLSKKTCFSPRVSP